MARYKDYSYDQKVMLPISLSDQILPGTFEYTLNKLIDSIDLAIFDDRYKNDEGGCTAYDPAILLKIILYAYSKGIVSSRKIASLCEENIVCIALSADTRPHFTTIANFISSMADECAQLFTKVLAVCYSENLIGKNMFAIDGCKISSNCSKEWSGTKKDMVSKAEKIRKAVDYLVKKHEQVDQDSDDPGEFERERKSIEKLNGKIEKITHWLSENEDRIGSQGKPVKSNITDNESAKMATSHGVIQGYNGIAAVDDKHQTIVWAGVYGDSNESSHLPEILDGIETTCRQTGLDPNIYETVAITADSGYHSEHTMEVVCSRKIDAYIADHQFRKRDVRFQTAGRHKKTTAAWQTSVGRKYYGPDDFSYDEKTKQLVCPAGKPLWLKCANYRSSDRKHTGTTYMGYVESCMKCEQRAKCLRSPNTKARQVLISSGAQGPSVPSYAKRMREKFDTPHGRKMYSRRMGTVEPVFGNLRAAKGLDRFTLRGTRKVNIQWLLYCMVHNIGKIGKYAE